MKNSLWRNPFLYASTVLTVALAFQVHSIVTAQTSSYTGPSGAPTAGNPAQPLDTGAGTQYKIGSFGIGNASENIILRLVSGARELFFTEGLKNAAIKLDPASGKLLFRHSDDLGFKELGTGGESLWVPDGAGGGIVYEAGTVRVKGQNVIVEPQVTVLSDTSYYYEYVGVNEVGSLTPTLSCDTGTGEECPATYISTSFTSASPTVAYDQFRILFCRTIPHEPPECNEWRYFSKKYERRANTTSETRYSGGVIRGRLDYSSEFEWRQGFGAVRMIYKDEGFCFLTRIAGKFEGGGESVNVYIGDDGFWYLGGSSGQIDVTARARCAGVGEPRAALNPDAPTGWKDVLGSDGNWGESCVAWLTRISQAGSQRRTYITYVTPPREDLGKCIYKVGNESMYWYEYSPDTTVNEAMKPVVGYPVAGTDPVGTETTQSYR